MKLADRIEQLKGLLGTKFGRLTVVEITETPGSTGKISYGIKCVCECGKVSFPKREKLMGGETRSCGCLRKEKMRKAFFARRGNKKTEEMTIWDWR